MAEELIYKVKVTGTDQVKKLEKAVTEAGNPIRRTTNYMQDMNRELEVMRGEMMRNVVGSDKYNKALARASEIQTKLNDTNKKVNAGVRDLGQTTRNITGAMAGFAGGFQVVQSAMSLFGIENEETIKTVLKLQQTMSIVQGLGTFAQGIQSMQDLVASFRASAEVASDLSGSMDKTSKSMDNANDSADALDDTVIETSSNLAGATNAADESAKGFNKLANSTMGAKEATLEATKTTLIDNNALIERTKSEIALAKQFGRSAEEIKELEDKLKELTDQQIEHVKATAAASRELRESGETAEKTSKSVEKLDKSTKKLGKSVGSFGVSILKSLGTMAAFLAIIWGITEAITALTKWLSRVPEDVKIDIELNSTVQEQIAKDRLEIRKYASDLRRATIKGDKEQIESLRNIGKERRNLTDIQLDQIVETEDGWIQAFKNYLEIAERTYKAEALMKMKIDAEMTRDAAQFAAEAKFKGSTGKDDLSGKAGSFWEGKVTWERLEAMAGDKRWLQKNLNNLYTMGVPQQILDELVARNAAQEIIDNLPEIDYEGLDFGSYKETKQPKRGKVSPGAAPDGSVKTPNKVENDMEVQYLKRRNVLVRELLEEELVIYEENMRRKDVTVSDSLVKHTKYQIKLGEARAKDLENQRGYLQESLDKYEYHYEEELAVQNKQLENAVAAHNMQLDNMREFLAQKDELETENSELRSRRSELDGELDAKEIATIDARLLKIKELRQANVQNIADTQELIALKKEQVKEIENSLTLLNNTPEEIARLKEELDILNLAIADNSRFLVDAMADNMQAMLDQARVYTDTIGQTFGSLESMTNDFMQAEDNKTAKEKNNLELSQEYREADSEQQQQMMYELELANYEAKKKTFETNKAFQIGAVVTQSAANQMDIIKAWLDPKTGGPLSPANIAVAAAATAANVATTIGSVKQISSTSLEKPVPPSGGAGGGAGGVANIALSPNKTGLTSKEENLNSMYKSGKSEEKDTVVKVSEINNVQNRVKVRERNSSY